MMRACFQYEATLLAQLVPSLAVYDGTDDDGDGDDDADSSQPVVPASNGEQNHGGFATQRLAVAVRSFLRQFTINMGPLVLVLDDLQWADPYSQEISASYTNVTLSVVGRKYWLFLTLFGFVFAFGSRFLGTG